jgi:hypothetical protein
MLIFDKKQPITGRGFPNVSSAKTKNADGRFINALTHKSQQIINKLIN